MFVVTRWPLFKILLSWKKYAVIKNEKKYEKHKKSYNKYVWPSNDGIIGIVIFKVGIIPNSKKSI